MEDVKLSLSTNFSDTSNNSVINSCKKRKYFTWDHHLPISQASIELDPVDPLPLHWEQCLDLQSGRMYYLNRKTLRKSWSKPKEQKLDLELNISSGFSSSKKREEEYCCYSWNKLSDSMSSNANMVAVACANCHLLVMLCKSSPSCPNCKYMHYSLPMYHATKPLKTLSLLH